MPDAEYRQQGTDMPKGSASQLDEALDVAEAAPERPAFDTSSIDESELPEVLGEPGTDDIDAELFAPTDHPDRPLTHGAPFGPGANFAVRPRMSDRAILANAANSILQLRDDVPTDALVWATRVLAGE